MYIRVETRLKINKRITKISGGNVLGISLKSLLRELYRRAETRLKINIRITNSLNEGGGKCNRNQC